MSNETTIKCPNCQVQIDVNEILYHQLGNELKQKNLDERKKLEKELEEKSLQVQELNKSKIEIEKLKIKQKDEQLAQLTK